jgi:hypothetical protein
VPIDEVPELLTIAEAAKLLRISRTTAYTEAKRFERTGSGLPVIRIGRSLRAPRDKLRLLMEGGWRSDRRVNPSPRAIGIAAVFAISEGHRVSERQPQRTSHVQCVQPPSQRAQVQRGCLGRPSPADRRERGHGRHHAPSISLGPGNADRAQPKGQRSTTLEAPCLHEGSHRATLGSASTTERADRLPRHPLAASQRPPRGARTRRTAQIAALNDLPSAAVDRTRRPVTHAADQSSLTRLPRSAAMSRRTPFSACAPHRPRSRHLSPSNNHGSKPLQVSFRNLPGGELGTRSVHHDPRHRACLLAHPWGSSGRCGVCTGYRRGCPWR